MQPDTIDRFVELVVRSGLATQVQVTELINQFQASQRSTKKSADVAAFCKFLGAHEVLTAWQCEKLRQGKFKGFYLHNYLFLDHLGKDSDLAYYKARDIRNGKLVRLTVTPMNRSPGPDIEYRVDPYME